MNNINYKKKYLKYKIKYNNLKLYGGDLKEEADNKIKELIASSNIAELCVPKGDCINEDEDLIQKCQDNIIDFKLKYMGSGSSLTTQTKDNYEKQIQTIKDNLNYYKFTKACEIKSGLMYSPTECQQLITDLKPSFTVGDTLSKGAEIVTKGAEAVTKGLNDTVDAAGKAVTKGLNDTADAAGKAVDAAGKAVDELSVGLAKGLFNISSGISSGWGISSRLNWGSSLGGALTDDQKRKIVEIEAQIKTHKTKLPSNVNSIFGNLVDNFDSLAQGVFTKLTNLGDMSIKAIKEFPKYKETKSEIETELTKLNEKKIFLTEMIKNPPQLVPPQTVPINYEKKLEVININIIKIEEALKNLDSPFSLITIGLLSKISEIAANPLDKIKEICTSYFMSSLKLIEIANDLYNYTYIIDKYTAKLPQNDDYKKKLENYKQKIIITTEQIKIFITSQIRNIENINEQISTTPATTITPTPGTPITPTPGTLAASNNFKTTLELSLDPQKIINKANKTIQKLHRIFILIDNKLNLPPFIDYKNDILSGIHKLKKITK